MNEEYFMNVNSFNSDFYTREIVVDGKTYWIEAEMQVRNTDKNNEVNARYTKEEKNKLVETYKKRDDLTRKEV